MGSFYYGVAGNAMHFPPRLATTAIVKVHQMHVQNKKILILYIFYILQVLNIIGRNGAAPVNKDDLLQATGCTLPTLVRCV